MKLLVTSAIAAALCSSCANAQPTSQEIDFDNPSAMECASFYQSFIVIGEATYVVTDEISDSRNQQRLVDNIIKRNMFLDIVVSDRGLDETYPRINLTRELYETTLRFRDMIETFEDTDAAQIDRIFDRLGGSCETILSAAS